MRVIIPLMLLFWIVTGCTPGRVAYGGRLEEAKGYALSVCIAYMNKSADSLSVINRDYSGEYFVQSGRLSLDEIVAIKEYVEKGCMDYMGVPKDPEGNMIAYSSWKFYNSRRIG